VEVPLFLTIQFATEKAWDSTVDVRDHTIILGDWMMSNPITQKGFVSIQSLLITKAYRC
jgi:hypothetical protein